VIVVRFKLQAKPDKADDVLAALKAVVSPSRELEGVVSFDIGRDVTDPNSFIATEVFEDQAARERQESLAEVANVMGMMEEAVAGPPEATQFEISSSQDAM
jgi:quinol monooxygenase YgiN